MTLAGSEDAVMQQKMIELERELIEFQESSKELEQALEEELQSLETRNALLLAQVQEKDQKIRELTQNIASLNKELVEQTLLAADQVSEQEKEISDLKHKLVHMEILNDDMLSQDRVLESKYQLATQFNNELLEKIALVENELDLERQASARQRLIISNLENAAQTCEIVKENKVDKVERQRMSMKNTRRVSTIDDFSFADGTVLDIGEMLASEPPKTSGGMPHSESLMLFHELYSRSSMLRQKVGEVNSTLALKSPSTTQLTKKTTASGALTPTTPLSPLYFPDISLSVEARAIPANQAYEKPAPPLTRKKTTLRTLVKGFIRV